MKLQTVNNNYSPLIVAINCKLSCHKVEVY